MPEARTHLASLRGGAEELQEILPERERPSACLVDEHPDRDGASEQRARRRGEIGPAFRPSVPDTAAERGDRHVVVEVRRVEDLHDRRRSTHVPPRCARSSPSSASSVATSWMNRESARAAAPWAPTSPRCPGRPIDAAFGGWSTKTASGTPLIPQLRGADGEAGGAPRRTGSTCPWSRRHTSASPSGSSGTVPGGRTGGWRNVNVSSWLSDSAAERCGTAGGSSACGPGRGDGVRPRQGLDGKTIGAFRIPGAQSQQAIDLLTENSVPVGVSATVVFSTTDGITDASVEPAIQESLTALVRSPASPASRPVRPLQAVIVSDQGATAARSRWSRSSSRSSAELQTDVTPQMQAAVARSQRRRAGGVRRRSHRLRRPAAEVERRSHRAARHRRDPALAFGSVIAMGLPIITALFGLAVGLSLISVVARSPTSGRSRRCSAR